MDTQGERLPERVAALEVEKAALLVGLREAVGLLREYARLRQYVRHSQWIPTHWGADLEARTAAAIVVLGEVAGDGRTTDTQEEGGR